MFQKSVCLHSSSQHVCMVLFMLDWEC